jgi:hypothetical protein
VRGKRFIIGLLKQKESAMSIFETHAGLKPGAALPLEPSDVPLLQKDVEQYESVVEYVLEVCGGWLLPLAMRGALVRASGYHWGEVRERIRASVVAIESDIAWKYVKHCVLHAVFLSNLQLACELPCDHGLYLVLGSATCRDEFRRRVDFAEKYQALAVLGATRSFPVYALGALFGVSHLEGEVIARVLHQLGLPRCEWSLGLSNVRVMFMKGWFWCFTIFSTLLQKTCATKQVFLWRGTRDASERL